MDDSRGSLHEFLKNLKETEGTMGKKKRRRRDDWHIKSQKIKKLTSAFFVFILGYSVDACQSQICIDPFYKWLPIINSFVNIKINLTNLVFELIIQTNFYSQTSLVGLI